jgi:hypothetical protein
MSYLQTPFGHYELFALLAFVPLWRLFRRAGLAAWPALTVFVPMVGLALAGSALAFPKWPALPEKKQKKAARA